MLVFPKENVRATTLFLLLYVMLLPLVYHNVLDSKWPYIMVPNITLNHIVLDSVTVD